MEIQTSNGSATIISASRDGFITNDFSDRMMDGHYKIDCDDVECPTRSFAADGVVYVKGSDGRLGRVAYIRFYDEETKNNYMADWGI